MFEKVIMAIVIVILAAAAALFIHAIANADTEIKVVAGDMVNLSWQANPEPDVMGYHIWKRPIDDPEAWSEFAYTQDLTYRWAFPPEEREQFRLFAVQAEDLTHNKSILSGPSTVVWIDGGIAPGAPAAPDVEGQSVVYVKNLVINY